MPATTDLRKDLNLTGEGGIASSWPNLEDGRQIRVFVQDSRLTADEGDNTDMELYKKVLVEGMRDLLAELDPQPHPDVAIRPPVST